MSDVFTLYGESISLYTGKVRAYLRYKNIPFVEKSITSKIIKAIGYFMIPVLQTPEGELVQDTTEIIDYLEQRFPGPSVYPEHPVQNLNALLIEAYADEWLVIPAMHYRWNYNRDYILREFGQTIVPEGTEAEQYAAGEKIAAPFSSSLPVLGINAASEPAIEAWYTELLQQLNRHLEGREYLFGSRPSIADFGLMGPLYAHNYRDPFSGDLMRAQAPRLVRWVDMMNTPNPNSGQFETGLTTTLQPVMQRIFLECIPAMVATGEALSEWFDAHPDTRTIPRSIGSFDITIGDSLSKRSIFPFNYWMFQRPLNYYRALSGTDKAMVDEYLHGVGGYECMQYEPKFVLKRENYQLLRAD